MGRLSGWDAFFALAVAAAVWLDCAHAAAAGPKPLQLEWSAPHPECPSSAQLEDQVAELVERFPSTAHPVRAVAQVERVADQHYRVRLTTDVQGARGSRVIEERSCPAAANVVALILAWMIQPELAGAQPSDPGAEVKEPEPSAAERPPDGPSKRPPSARTTEWSLSLRGAGDLGSMPKSALGGLLAVGYRAGRLQVSLQASHFPTSRAEVPRIAGFSATGGEFSLAALALHGCWEPTRARVALCLGPELSQLRGRGFGVSSPGEGAKAWLSLAVGLRSALHLTGRLWLEAAAEAVVPTRREQFVLDGVGLVHQPSAVAARASFGLGFTL